MNTIFKRFVSILCCVLIVTAVDQACACDYVPAIFNIVLDASGSVSRNDFQKANQIVADFIRLIHARAHEHPGQLADWVMVNWFGGDMRAYQYGGTRFINGSDHGAIKVLYKVLQSARHPRHNYTAIYSAIEQATIEVVEQDRMLRSHYAKFVILVTDGVDNDSSNRARRVIKRLYPDDDLFLIVVGVGDRAGVGEFRGLADEVVRINQFDQLLAVLTLTLELLPACN